MKKQTNKGLLGVFLKRMIPKVAKTFFSVVAKVVNKGSKVVNPRIIAIFSNHYILVFSQVGEQLNKTRYHLQNPYASLSLSLSIYTYIYICVYIYIYTYCFL